MDGIFILLEDQKFFSEFVRDDFLSIPGSIQAVMWCKQEVDPERVEFAYNEYKLGLEGFQVFLGSSNPDHYKRAGALLHALYRSDCVSLQLESSADELEAGFTRVNAGDAEQVLSFVKFYEEYYNQFLSFNLAYRLCASYEDDPRTYDFDYLHNVSRYLKVNTNLSRDSLFMLFKSLMI